jgi:hypothetical protein
MSGSRNPPRNVEEEGVVRNIATIRVLILTVGEVLGTIALIFMIQKAYNLFGF